MIKYYDYDESDAYLEWINDQVYRWVKFVLEEFEVNNDCYENQYAWIENFFPRSYLEDNPLEKCVSVFKDILYILKAPELRSLTLLQQYVCIKVLRYYVESIEDDMRNNFAYDYLIVPMKQEVLDTLDETETTEDFWKYHLEDIEYNLFDYVEILLADFYTEGFLHSFVQGESIPLNLERYYDILSRNVKEHYNTLYPALTNAKEVYLMKQGQLIGELVSNKLEKKVLNKQLIEDICNACYMLQGSVMHVRKHENSYNTYIRDILRNKKYIVADQTEHGRSVNGKEAGKIDLEVLNTENSPVAIFEGLILKSSSASSKEYFKIHLNKLLNYYNPVGVQSLFLTCYVFCKREVFEDLYLSYKNYIKETKLDNYLFIRSEHLEHGYHNLFIEQVEYQIGCKEVTVYLLMIYMGEEKVISF